jgi:hypothetical protein
MENFDWSVIDPWDKRPFHIAFGMLLSFDFRISLQPFDRKKVSTQGSTG